MLMEDCSPPPNRRFDSTTKKNGNKHVENRAVRPNPPPPIPPSLPLSPDDPLNQLQSHSTDVDKQNVLVDSMDPNCPKITEGFSQMKGLLKTPKINKWAECDQSY